MANVTARIRPSTQVRHFDHLEGRNVGVEFDGLMVFVGDGAASDESIVIAADHLIDALTMLREAARDRIRLAARDEELREHAHEATAEQMLRGGYVASYDALPDIAVAVVDPRKPSGLRPLTPDEGDWFVRPGEVA